jgi:hypothetical protein
MRLPNKLRACSTSVYRLKARRGYERATVAVAHKIPESAASLLVVRSATFRLFREVKNGRRPNKELSRRPLLWLWVASCGSNESGELARAA